MIHRPLTSCCLVLFLFTTPAFLCAGDTDALLRDIARAGPQGAYSAKAHDASRELGTRGIDALPRLLDGMDTENIVAANWCRLAFDQIVRRELSKDKPQLPIAKLKQFARNAKRQGRPRRLVVALLERCEPGFRSQLLASALDDPEFRADAIDRLFELAEAIKDDAQLAEKRSLLQRAFQNARDSGQVTRAANRLKQVGVDVDIVRHMGFVTRWRLLGPFDAPGVSGFDVRYPPEERVDLKADYDGKLGRIHWRLFETSDRLGQVNLVQAIAPVKEAVGFAYTELESPRQQQAELRCGADDNISVWLNGSLAFARRQWLNGTRLDRFTAPVTLKQGANQVLVKVCQGPQHKNPAVPNNWSMQLRFCDALGGSVGLTNLLPPIKEKK